jgi:hypothetical protein
MSRSNSGLKSNDRVLSLNSSRTVRPFAVGMPRVFDQNWLIGSLYAIGPAALRVAVIISMT